MEYSEMTPEQRVAKNRGYRLGERNPDTLPRTGDHSREPMVHNTRASREWRSLRRIVQSGGMTGAKYV